MASSVILQRTSVEARQKPEIAKRDDRAARSLQANRVALMSSRGTIASRFIFFNLLVTFALSAASQTANLSGAVKDSFQAAVVGANVSISRESTGAKQTVTSSERGIYRFAFLLPGSYTIHVEAQGFEVVNRAGVKLDPGREARLDFVLSPAMVKENITVSGSASSVQTESPAVSTEIDPQLVRDLPLNGRSFQSLIFLTPGVVATSSCWAAARPIQREWQGTRQTTLWWWRQRQYR